MGYMTKKYGAKFCPSYEFIERSLRNILMHHQHGIISNRLTWGISGLFPFTYSMDYYIKTCCDIAKLLSEYFPVENCIYLSEEVYGEHVSLINIRPKDPSHRNGIVVKDIFGMKISLYPGGLSKQSFYIPRRYYPLKVKLALKADHEYQYERKEERSSILIYENDTYIKIKGKIIEVKDIWNQLITAEKEWWMD